MKRKPETNLKYVLHDTTKVMRKLELFLKILLFLSCKITHNILVKVSCSIFVTELISVMAKTTWAKDLVLAIFLSSFINDVVEVSLLLTLNIPSR